MVIYSSPLRISKENCRYGYEDVVEEAVLYRLEDMLANLLRSRSSVLARVRMRQCEDA